MRRFHASVPGELRIRLSQPTYVDAPLVGKPDVVPKSVAVRSGTVVCAASWCGTFLAAGPYGVREIGSKSQWRARWPIVGYWFFRPRLADRLPLPCPPSCLPSPVGTFPAHAHWRDRAVTPRYLISRLLRVPGLANASSLHGSDSQPYAAAETAFVTPRAL